MGVQPRRTSLNTSSHPDLRAQAQSILAHRGEAFLSFCFRHSHWLRRQLKHRRLLTATQLGQENNAPIRKFERIMVRPLLVLIYLSEDCRRVNECFDFPTDDKAGFCNCNRAGKRELGPRKNADRHGIVFRRSEPVPVPKSCVVSLSPTFAGRDLTLWRL